MHNLRVRDGFAFVSHYTIGLKIIDLQDPTAPSEVASFDAFPGTNPFTFGMWGVSADNRSHLLAADFNTGFYVVDFRPVDTAIARTYIQCVNTESIWTAQKTNIHKS